MRIAFRLIITAFRCIRLTQVKQKKMLLLLWGERPVIVFFRNDKNL